MSAVTGFLLSGGAFALGLLALVGKGMISGTVAHFWKKYLARKDKAHEASRCPHDTFVPPLGGEGQLGAPRPKDHRG